MKIAFIVPPNVHSIEALVSRDVEEGRGFYPPLGLLYVAAGAEKWAGAEVEFIDCQALRMSMDDLVARIEQMDVALVGMSVMTFNLLNVIEAARLIKKVRPEIKVAAGGIHCSLYPLETLNLPEVDFIFAGEAERSFAAFVTALETGRRDDFPAIKGLGYKDEAGKPHFNAELDLIKNLDEVPWPDRQHLDFQLYRQLIGVGDTTVTIQSSRGCPFACCFCDMRRSKFRTRSAEDVVDELAHLFAGGFNDFFFIDDTITVDRKRLIRICELIKERRLPIRFKISARADTLDPEILASLKSAGCYRLHIGVESGTPRHLEFLQKGVTVERVRQAFDEAHAAGLETFAYCMIGVPGETREEMMDTVDFAVSLRPRYAQFAVCTPYPKTALYEYMLAEGMIPEDYWQVFAESPTTDFKLRFWNKHFSDDELRVLQGEAHRRFYGRSSYMFSELMKVRSWPDFTQKLKMGMKILLQEKPQ